MILAFSRIQRSILMVVGTLLSGERLHAGAEACPPMEPCMDEGSCYQMASKRHDLGVRLSYGEKGLSQASDLPLEKLSSKALAITSDDRICLYFSRPILKGLDLKNAIKLKVSPAHPGALTRVNDSVAVWTAARPLALHSTYNFQLLSLQKNGQKWIFPASEFSKIEQITPMFVIVKFLAVYDVQKNIDLYAFLSAPPDFKEFAKRVEIRLNGKRFQTDWKQGLTPEVMRTTLGSGVHAKPLKLTVHVSGKVPALAEPAQTLPPHEGTPLTLDPPVIVPSPMMQFESPTREALDFFEQQMMRIKAPGPGETQLATARLPELFPDWPLTEDELAGYAAPDEQIAIYFADGRVGPLKDIRLSIHPPVEGQFEPMDGLVVWTPKKPLEYERIHTFRLLSAPPSPHTEIKIKARKFAFWAYKSQQLSNATTRFYLFLSGPVELNDFTKSVMIERDGKSLQTLWKAIASGRILYTDLAVAARGQPLSLNLIVRTPIPAMYYKDYKILPQKRLISLPPITFERQWIEFDRHIEETFIPDGLE